MKKIMHIIEALPRGGAETLLYGVVNEMKDFEHVVVHLRDKNDFGKFHDGPVVCINHTKKKQVFASVRKVRRLIREHKPDIVHTHLYWPTVIGRLAVKKRLPFVFTVHSIYSQDAFAGSSISKLIEKATYKKNQLALFVSDTARKDYSGMVGLKGPNQVLYNYIEPKMFSKDGISYQPGETLKLVAVGNLKKAKNYFYLIDVMEGLKNEPVELYIYGDGNLRQAIEEKIKTKNLNNIKLCGRVADLENHLGKYDVYVMASTHEGFGIAPMEAMAMGLPVLLSDIEVFKEVAGDTALYFDPYDTGSLQHLIGSIKAGDHDMEELAKKGRIRAEEIGTKKEYLNRLKEIYSGLLDGKAE